MIIIDMLYSIWESQMEVHATWSLTCCTLFVSHRWRSIPHDHNWHGILYLSVTYKVPYTKIIDMLYSVTDEDPCRMIEIAMLYSICQSQMKVYSTWSLTCCTLFVSHRWRSMPHDHWHVVLYLSVTDGGPYHMITDMLYSICQSQMEVHTTWSSLTCCTLFVSHRWRSIPQDHWHVVLNLSVTDGGPCNMIIEMLYSYVSVTDEGLYHMIIIGMLYSMCKSQMEVHTTWS